MIYDSSSPDTPRRACACHNEGPKAGTLVCCDHRGPQLKTSAIGFLVACQPVESGAQGAVKGTLTQVSTCGPDGLTLTRR
jgi:hypothetical protein